MRVAFTLEQLWHRVPGGTGVAALETAREMVKLDGVRLCGVAGTHPRPPDVPWASPIPVAPLAGSGARLYACWLWGRRPAVERATGPVDVTHATTIIPCPTNAPLVVTIHDLAFIHAPEQFSRWGTTVFRRSLEVIRRRAALILCSSSATMDDCARLGLSADRLRLVPLGVTPPITPSPETIAATRARFGVEGDYLTFVGTVEPRKNLRRLVEAVACLGHQTPLVVIGPPGWGDARPPEIAGADVRFTGRLPALERDALVAGATAMCYPSLREGFGLPILEAMALGVPVVTSRGTATAETAGSAAVLVEPTDVEDIARGITEAIARRADLAAAGRVRAAELTWGNTAELTLAAYREVA